MIRWRLYLTAALVLALLGGGVWAYLRGWQAATDAGQAQHDRDYIEGTKDHDRATDPGRVPDDPAEQLEWLRRIPF